MVDEVGGDKTVGTVCLSKDPRQFLSLGPGNDFLGFLSLKLGENLMSLGDRGLGSWGLTWCLSGGLMVGINTSVNTLLSRLCREREGRRAWLGGGVVGVQKVFLAPYSEEGVG